MPSTTEASGSSASETGKPVSIESRLSRFFNKRAAAGQHDAALDDVGRKFGRSAFERDAHGVDDRRDRIGQRFANFFVGDRDRLRNAFDQVAAANFVRKRFVERVSRAEFNLDRFGSSFADQQIVFPLDVLR